MKLPESLVDLVKLDKIQDVIDFVINVFALYGLLVLIFKYIEIPSPITFDMVAVAFLVLKCGKMIVFTKK